MPNSRLRISYRQHILSLQLDSPRSIYDYLMQIWNRKLLNLQEQVYVVFLNRNNEVICWKDIHTGTTSSVSIDIKLVVSIALHCLATKIVVAHNHPGRVHRPSAEDVAVTRQLDQAAQLFDIHILDHLIVFDDGFYSMREHRLL